MHSHLASAIRAQCHIQVEAFEWRRLCWKPLAFALQWLWMIWMIPNQWVPVFRHRTFFFSVVSSSFDSFVSVCGYLACPDILNQYISLWYMYNYIYIWTPPDFFKSTMWEITVQRIIDKSLSNQHLQRPSEMQWTQVFSWEPLLSPGHSRFLKGLACRWILVAQISMFERSESHQQAMLPCKQISYPKLCKLFLPKNAIGLPQNWASI